MGQVFELLDKLETIVKDSLPNEKAREFKKVIAELSEEIAKETFIKEAPKIEENLSKRLVTKEDFFNFKEEFYEFKVEVEKRFSAIEKELNTVKTLLWVLIVLTAISTFPQLLNLLKLLK